MRQSIYPIFFSGLICIAAGIIYWLKKENTQLSQEKQQLSEIKSNIEKLYLNIIATQWELEGDTIFMETRLLNQNKDTFTLRDLIGISSKPTFILNFNWDACQDCINQEVELIQQELMGLYNVIVLISFNTLNEYLSYAQSNQTPFPVFHRTKPPDVDDTLAHDYGVFGFILTRDGRILFPHVASSSLPELSRRYYKIITEKSSTL